MQFTKLDVPYYGVTTKVFYVTKSVPDYGLTFVNDLADVHCICAIYSQNEKLFKGIENPCKPHQIKQIPLISDLFKN